MRESHPNVRYSPVSKSSHYSPGIGFIFVFNLIVGTGALTIPKAFNTAGWLFSLILLVVLCFLSYITTTFVVESMAAANAVLKWKRMSRHVNGDDSGVSDSEMDSATDDRDLLVSSEEDESSHAKHFAITEVTEMGQMVSLFFNGLGKTLFYITMCLYLFGDLAIYAAALPVSLRTVACTFPTPNTTQNVSESDVQCWPGVDNITRIDAYRIFLTGFVMMLAPFTFFNVQKTKYLQIITTLFRWLAFTSMIVFASMKLASSKARTSTVPVAQFSGLPSLVGSCVYAFMCHHSLPSLITPIQPKSNLYRIMALDFIVIFIFYGLLGFTGLFAFDNLQSLYTLNFDVSETANMEFFHYFLQLFPVFTLSTSFPIMAITLRNNLRALFRRKDPPTCCDRIVFPLLAIIPPVTIAFITDDITFLVNITGSYAGAMIQYVVPATLVLCSRKETIFAFGQFVPNVHSSPFRNRWWAYIVLFWAYLCIILVTVNHIVNKN